MVTMSMNHHHLLLLFLLPLASSLSETLPINVWPKPINISWPKLTAAPLSPSFTILSPYPNHPNLAASISRYSRLILSENYRPIVPPIVALATSYPLLSLALSISDPSAPLQHGVDESYTLTISTTGAATVSAATIWGAMRGLETFSQLTWGGDPTIVATGVQISDRPMFKHRGIMLDTSRNYYPVDDILRTIGAMSANKLNVFHWHITDSHSFPLVLPSEPALAAKGSYGPGRQYSPADVKTIVDFGLDHGVRVMPEFDMPGHTASWAGAYPDIITCANMFWLPNASDVTTALAAEPGTGQLNPLNPKTYAVVRNVIRDAAALFPEPFFHAGADEINPNCWKSDPLIQSFLAGGGTLGNALEQFVNATHPHIVSLNRTVVYWEDILLNPTINVSPSLLPPSTTILQTWNNGPNNTKRIVAAGYRAIVSSSDFYFLDCGHGDFVGNDSFYDGVGSDVGTDGRSWCGPYKTWQRVYDYDVTYGLSAAEAELVMGGEVAMWSEQADAAVMDGRMWPRAAAMAEAMWSGNRGRGGEKRYAEATDRIFDWRERMVGRGVRAEPIQPLWCRSRPGMCNLVH